ncbi:MAG: hypothetical protein LC754_01180 [Acidobacteria bacterium]|nr:hypothetical protein [Acidobacteriota bacterium]
MKPLKSELQDDETLRELGSASVQIVHDLKNQLNGLKLYATFLRKRMEKSERPADEQETVAKLIAGLERAAADMTLLVRLGRPIELRRQPGTDLARILSNAAGGRTLQVEAGSYAGAFDVAVLEDALKTISCGGRTNDTQDTQASDIHLRREESGETPSAVIEWRGVAQAVEGGDIFNSFSGGSGLRMTLAGKIIKAHDGGVDQHANSLRVRLPLEP